jgi:hypothetical protein
MATNGQGSGAAATTGGLVPQPAAGTPPGASTAGGAVTPAGGGIMAAPMLAAGVLTALSGRRLGAGPAAAPRGVDAALRWAADFGAARFVDGALRLLGSRLADLGRPLPPVYAASLTDEAIVLYMAPPEPDRPPAPFGPGSAPGSWCLPRDPDTLDGLPAEGGPVLRTPAPYPGLVTVGRHEAGLGILVDLEGAPGVIGLEGDPVKAREVAVAAAVELATSLWADSLRVWLVGFSGGPAGISPEGLTAVAPHRLRAASSVTEILDEIDERAAARREAGLDSRADAVLRGRQAPRVHPLWAPDLLVLASPPPEDEVDRLARRAHGRDHGVGVLAVGDTRAARWRFRVDAHGRMSLDELELDVDAQHLSQAEAAAIASLLRPAGPAGPAAPGHARARPRAEPVGPPGRPDAPGRGAEPGGPAARGPAQAGAAQTMPPAQTVPAPPAEVRLLGTPKILGPGVVDDDHADVVTEFIVCLALHRDGVEPAELAKALWPGGAPAGLATTTLGRAQRWLGCEPHGPRVGVGRDGRWQLSPQVTSDWDGFLARTVRAGTASRDGRADLAGALEMIDGPLWANLPEGRYGWLETSRIPTVMRTSVTLAAHRLAVLAAGDDDVETVLSAARQGLRAVPAAEILWRDLLGAVARRGDRQVVEAVATEMYRTLDAAPDPGGAGPETDALVRLLLPGFRRPPRLLSAAGSRPRRAPAAPTAAPAIPTAAPAIAVEAD